MLVMPRAIQVDEATNEICMYKIDNILLGPHLSFLVLTHPWPFPQLSSSCSFIIFHRFTLLFGSLSSLFSIYPSFCQGRDQFLCRRRVLYKSS